MRGVFHRAGPMASQDACPVTMTWIATFGDAVQGAYFMYAAQNLNAVGAKTCPEPKLIPRTGPRAKTSRRARRRCRSLALRSDRKALSMDNLGTLANVAILPSMPELCKKTSDNQIYYINNWSSNPGAQLGGRDCRFQNPYHSDRIKL